MKKTLLTGAVILSLGASSNASAIAIDITSMTFGSTSAASGRADTDNLGTTYNGVFFGAAWTATTMAAFDTVGEHTFTGGTCSGSATYNFSLSKDQYAFGTYFDWSVSCGIPVLNIMDCSNGVFCTGIGTPLLSGPFPGQVLSFNGVVVGAVPLPASVWLFGSGIVGLLGFLHRAKAE